MSKPLNFIKTIFNSRIVKSLFYPSNYKTENFLCGIGKSEIGENEIYISEYPFKPSVAYPNKLISANDINFIAADFGYCRIYVENDIIFVTSEQKMELLKL